MEWKALNSFLANIAMKSAPLMPCQKDYDTMGFTKSKNVGIQVRVCLISFLCLILYFSYIHRFWKDKKVIFKLNTTILKVIHNYMSDLEFHLSGAIHTPNFIFHTSSVNFYHLMSSIHLIRHTKIVKGVWKIKSRML